MKLAVTTGLSLKNLVFISKIVISHRNLTELVHINYINKFGNTYIDRLAGTDWFNNEYL